MRTFLLPILVLLSFNKLSAQDWQDKVDQEVLEIIDSLGTVSTMVVFQQQADLSSIDINWTKTEKAEEAYRLLKEATSTQADVKVYLDSVSVPYRSFYIVNMIAVDLNKSMLEVLASKDVISQITRDQNITFAEPFVEKKESQTRSPEVEWGIKMIQADSVWRLGYEGQDVVIGGQDTGYEWDLGPLRRSYRGYSETNVDHNYSWHDAIRRLNPMHGDSLLTDSTKNPCGLDAKTPCDDNSHGTHTMGTMVGQDSVNYIGVAPAAKWVGCRCMERGYGTPSNYIECFEWFLAPTDLDGENANPTLAPHVINNSWGCPLEEGCTPENFHLMDKAVNALKASGVVVVVSAGNDGSDCNTVMNPAAILENSFSVGATNSEDTIASFSSRGPVAIDSSFRMKPNVSAPGVSVRSVIRGGGFGSFSGTSMAGPHVAGAVALIISANPDLAGQVDKIEDILELTAVPKTSSQECDGFSGQNIPNPTFGYGRIDALAAVQMAIGTTKTDQEVELPHTALVFPNPTSGWTALRATSDIHQAYVFDIQGNLIKSIKASDNEVLVDLSNYKGGLCTYQLHTEKGILSGKIVVN